MTKEKKSVILVVGDWVIDEYQFLVRHHSDISSATGFNHYRLCSEIGDITLDLCGAGYIIKTLYKLSQELKLDYSFVGIGKWHKGDEEFISHLIHAPGNDNNCYVQNVQPSLTPLTCSIPNDDNYELYSIDAQASTTKVTRQYRQKDGEIEQIHRVDFELFKSTSKNVNRNQFLSKIKLLSKPHEIKAIVVVDLDKGVINEELIDTINSIYPSAPWYIRSKVQTPKWLQSIKSKINLFLVGPELELQNNPTNILLAEKGISYHAKQIIEFVLGKCIAKYIAITSNRGEVVFLHTMSNQVITGNPDRVLKEIEQPTWTGALFANMTRQIMVMEDDKKPIDQKTFENVLRSTNVYSGVPLPKVYQARKESIEFSYSNCSWKEERKSWEEAFKNHGFIETKEKSKRLDVWRSYTELPYYVTCAKRKQEIVNIIGQKLRDFRVKTSPSSSLSIYLVADPGTGKTYLAKNLSSTFDYTFVSFDLTQIIYRDGLTKIFDTIATRQANDTKPVLVFIDEINTLLDGSHAYSSFLAPLEEGIYIRDNQSFSLKPCAWIFAGTHSSGSDTTDPEKHSDFKSRMTMILNIDYHSLFLESRKDTSGQKVKKLEKASKLEQVYLGATMIKRFFPEVTKVSENILKSFYQLQPDHNPSRIIRNITSSLRNVQHHTVTLNNLDTLTISTLSKLRTEQSDKNDTAIKKGFRTRFSLPKIYRTWLEEKKDNSEIVNLIF